MSTRALGIVLLLLVCLTGAAWFFQFSQKGKFDRKADRVEHGGTIQAEITEEGWLKYHDVTYRFSLKYPKEWNYQKNTPYIPNLAEHTVTFYSPDGNSVVDIWIRKANWEQLVSEISNNQGAYQTMIGGVPAIVQTIDNRDEVIYAQHPTLAGMVVVANVSQGHSFDSDFATMREIKNSLTFD